MAAMLGLVALAVLAAAAPLLTYSVSLAVFGLAHVAVELRYVEGRFGPRLAPVVVAGLGALLAAVVGLRLAALAELADATTLVQLELAAVSGLAGLGLVEVGRRSGVATVTSAAVGGAVALGAAFAPVPTIVLLAALHNWTPLGFVAEATRGAARRRWLGRGLVAFGALPVLVALMQPAFAGWASQEWTVLATGPLQRNLGAYVPRDWPAGIAVPLFAGIAFAQCMHYAAVLGVLPRLSRPDAPVGPLTAVPMPAYFGAVVLGTLLLLVGYASDFADARRVYGVFAAVHAWVEVPLLLVALAPRSPP